jgi:hypothetical protein
MSAIPTIEAELTLLPTNEGGRQQPLYLGKGPPGSYRPHIVGRWAGWTTVTARGHPASAAVNCG